MLNILLKASGYIVVIILGIILRRVGFFKESDFSTLSKLVLRVTLPAALIAGSTNREMDPRLLVIALLGFGCGIVYIAAGWLFGRNRGKEQQAFDIVNLSGYNIGTFIVPFTQSFLGATGMMVTSIFDVGNAFIALGVSYGVAAAVKDGSSFDLKRVLKALAASLPFWAHISILLLNLLHITVPAPILDCAQIIGSANPFLAMLTIGVGFQLALDRTQIGKIARLLAIRFGIAAILALGFWFLLPFDETIRIALMLLAVCPLPSVVPVFTGEIESDVGLSCSLCSLTIVISIASIVSLLVLLL